MRTWLALAALPAVFATSARAQDLSKLPSWAHGPAQEAQKAPAPDKADAWVLLDRTEFAYTGSGEIRQRHFRLVKVLTEAGAAEEATYVLHGLGGNATKVKRLKGWNLRPDGEVVKLDSSDVVTINTDDDALTTETATGGRLAKVQAGSLLAFESLESIHHPLGPSTITTILENHPIRRWELIPAIIGGWFRDLKHVKVRMEARHLAPWTTPLAEPIEGGLFLDNLPALPRGEDARPHLRNAAPWVTLCFQDPALTGVPTLDSWDSLATWFHAAYRTKVVSLKAPALPDGTPAARMSAFAAWMSREITYKQVYLSPERGWIPEASEEVVRKRYGDCKDLTSCLMGGLANLGMESFPALARIGAGDIEADEPVGISAFNHVITAVKLPASLGFPAEIETPKGRFLLVDPTARYTRLGYLPEAHRRGRVLACTPQGGIWIPIPDAAIEPSGIRIEAQGSEDATLLLDGAYTFIETGDAMGLRSTFHSDGAKALKNRLASRWDFPPTTILDILSTSDPLDLSKPFTVKLGVRLLPALYLAMGEWTLNRLGFPGLPGTIQRPGTPRMFPVWVEPDHGGWEVSLRWTLATPLRPVQRTLLLDTPFRTLTGKCTLEGQTLQVEFSRVRKTVRFPYDQREEGVRQAKRDRSQTKSALDDFLSFKPQS